MVDNEEVEFSDELDIDRVIGVRWTSVVGMDPGEDSSEPGSSASDSSASDGAGPTEDPKALIADIRGLTEFQRLRAENVLNPEFAIRQDKEEPLPDGFADRLLANREAAVSELAGDEDGRETE